MILLPVLLLFSNLVASQRARGLPTKHRHLPRDVPPKFPPPKPHHLLPRQTDPNLPTPQTVTLKLDHFSSDPATFENRYWIYDAAYQSGGPVIIEDIGESNAGEFVFTMHQDLAAAVGNATRGLVILWEHRYYGASYPDATNLDPEDPESIGEWYKYLNVEQALEDVVEFAHGFKYKNEEVSPGKVPWIFTGGSYPGARAAWIRQRNPEIVFASFASSAVVEVTAELQEYQTVIFDYYKAHGLKSCMADLKALVDWMSEVVEESDARNYNAFMELVWGRQGSAVQTTYFSSNSASGTWDQAKANLAGLMNYVFQDYQYGINTTTVTFCEDLEIESQTNLATEGVVEQYGLSEGLDVLGVAFNKLFTNLIETSADSTTDNSTDTEYSAWDSTSWTYQTCSEMGYFFTDNELSDTPTFVNLQYSIQDCVDLFGSKVSGGPSLAPQKYGGMKKVNPSNTYWVDGEWDPWRPATPNALDSGRKASKKIPDAGKTLGDKEFFGAVVPNAFHVPLGSGSCLMPQVEEGKFEISPSGEDAEPCDKVVVETQQLFFDALEKWLPEFKQHDTPKRKVRLENETSAAGRVHSGVVLSLVVAVVAAVVII